MTARRLLRAGAGLIVMALLICVWAIIIVERCEQNMELNDITWEELVAAQSAQSNDGGRR